MKLKLKAKDLIKVLEEYPDFDVNVSVDISTSEEDAFKRCFSTEFLDDILVQNEEILLFFAGYVNE